MLIKTTEREVREKKKQIEQLQNKLDLVNSCNPSRAERVKARLYAKQLAKLHRELKKASRESELPPMLF